PALRHLPPSLRTEVLTSVSGNGSCATTEVPDDGVCETGGDVAADVTTANATRDMSSAMVARVMSRMIARARKGTNSLGFVSCVSKLSCLSWHARRLEVQMRRARA